LFEEVRFKGLVNEFRLATRVDSHAFSDIQYPVPLPVQQLLKFWEPLLAVFTGIGRSKRQLPHWCGIDHAGRLEQSLDEFVIGHREKFVEEYLFRQKLFQVLALRILENAL